MSMRGFRRVKFRLRKPQRNPQPKAGDEVETVNAHAGVLRAASPVLNAMLSGQGVRQTGPWYWARSLNEVSGVVVSTGALLAAIILIFGDLLDGLAQNVWIILLGHKTNHNSKLVNFD